MSSEQERKKKKKKDEMKVQRKRVATEIVQTESSYCKALHQIVAMYLLPLRQDGGMLSKKNLNIIFSNIESISSFHHEQLAAFERDPDMLGPSFQKLIPFLELYREYCANYGAAMEKLAEKTESGAKFANFLEKTRIEKQTLDLPSLLIQPIQRIPRYRLLVTELLKYTKESHSDHPLLTEALAQIETAATFVNESIRARENMEQLRKVQTSLIGKNVPDIVQENRALWREGVLVKMCRREPKRRYFFLFNDILVYASIEETSLGDTEYQFHRLINLDKCAVQVQEDTDVMQNAFQVLSNEKSFTVFAESPEVMNAWVQDIEDAIRQTQQQRFAESGAGPTEVAPVWVPDKMQKTCTYCDAKWTTINRRHHCRRCGALVCGSCSSNSHHLENLGKSARVCDKCYEELTGVPVFAKRASRRQSSAVPKDEYKRLMNESESKANLAKRATVLFGKGSTRSVVGIGTVPARRSSVNVRGPAEEQLEESSTSLTDVTSDATGEMSDGEERDGARRDEGKRRKKKRKKRDGDKRRKKKKKRDADVPLEEWSSEFLEEWLATHDDGKFKRFSTTFAGLTGADIALLSEQQITAHVPGLFGNVLYNVFQLHKREALEQAARQAEEDDDEEEEEEEDKGGDLAPPAHAPPSPPEDDSDDDAVPAAEEKEKERTGGEQPKAKPLPTPPGDGVKPLPKPPGGAAADVAGAGAGAGKAKPLPKPPGDGGKRMKVPAFPPPKPADPPAQ